MFGCNAETGRKSAPCPDLARQPARERYEEDAARLPKLTSADKMHEALMQQAEHQGITRSQVRRAVTAANRAEKAARPDAVDEDRRYRRSIKKGISATRPAAYPALLQRKRDTEREARRPQVEARAIERAQKAAQREAAVRAAQWAYDMCHAEEQQARALGASDLWYLRERRLDAGSALKIARGSNDTPRWELRAPRGPVYKRLSARPQTTYESDESEARMAELARDYGPTPPPQPAPTVLPQASPLPVAPLPPPLQVSALAAAPPRCKDCGWSGHASCVCSRRVVATWTLNQGGCSIVIPILEPCQVQVECVTCDRERSRLPQAVPVCQRCGAWNVEAGVCIEHCGG